METIGQQTSWGPTVPSTATEGGHPRPLGGGDTSGDFSVIVCLVASKPVETLAGGCSAGGLVTWGATPVPTRRVGVCHQ